MGIRNNALRSLSKAAKKLPNHRKLNHFYFFLTKILLKIGANPIVKAKMNDDTVMIVDLSTRTERAAYFKGVYDKDDLDLIQSLIKKDRCFLDVGANIGFYSVSMGNFFRLNYPTNRVVAYEAFKGNFNRLQKNIEFNKLSEYCLINDYGLSDKEGEQIITLREDFKGGSNTGNAAIPTNEVFDSGFKTAPIKLMTLDQVWDEKYGIIDWVKMDIEGHEDYCLKGAQKTISKQRPAILMEVNKAYYKARNIDLNDTFLPLFPEGYFIFKQKNNEWLPIKSLFDCNSIDNVVLLPKERLDWAGYHIFQA